MKNLQNNPLTYAELNNYAKICYTSIIEHFENNKTIFNNIIKEKFNVDNFDMLTPQQMNNFFRLHPDNSAYMYMYYARNYMSFDNDMSSGTFQLFKDCFNKECEKLHKYNFNVNRNETSDISISFDPPMDEHHTFHYIPARNILYFLAILYNHHHSS